MDDISVTEMAGPQLSQLREALQQRGLPSDGTKPELVEHLTTHVTAHGDKRPRVQSEGGSDDEHDDDVGPKIPTARQTEVIHGEGDATAPAEAPVEGRIPKRRRALANEHAYLDLIPGAGMYEKSYMHRDVVTHILVTPKTDFIVTASADGILKFWKKIPGGIEFVKMFRAHLASIAGIAVSSDGLRLCTVGDDSSIKYFDVLNFDMIDMTRLGFMPAAVAWIYRRGSVRPLLAVSDRHSPSIHIYNADKASEPEVHRVTLHASPVVAMCYNEAWDAVISADAKGLLEYWSTDPEGDYGIPPGLHFTFKSETDLFDVAKARATPHSLAVHPDGVSFLVTSSDRKIRLFRFATGKLLRVYSEAPEVYEAQHKEGKLSLEAQDFARRLAMERDLISSTAASFTALLSPPAPPTAGPAEAATPVKRETLVRQPPSNAVFDQSGHFVVFPTMVGIKVVNTVTNSVSAVLGKAECTDRFLGLALYQGIPKISSQWNVGKEAVPIMSQQTMDAGPKPDPTIVAAAFRRNRFYLFTCREPVDLTDEGVVSGALEGRDVFNEPPSKEDLAVAAESSMALQRQRLGDEAIIHTVIGDIFIKLLPEDAPKAVENFSTHSRNGYYNGLIFHRVIKSFMVQTGDPRGDGTGGTSIWGAEFEDEIHRHLRFDRPFVVAMANAGPNTNGSQFFITTVPTPWLDGKHTIFGRITRGMDVVRAIEQTPTDIKSDKPYEDIKILNIDIKTA